MTHETNCHLLDIQSHNEAAQPLVLYITSNTTDNVKYFGYVIVTCMKSYKVISTSPLMDSANFIS